MGLFSHLTIAYHRLFQGKSQSLWKFTYRLSPDLPIDCHQVKYTNILPVKKIIVGHDVNQQGEM